MLEDACSRFADPAAAASYAVYTTRKVPGLDDLHLMVTLLLAEQATGEAHMLVVGAGGGMELRSMAALRGDWSFTGVDPSRAMLELARERSRRLRTGSVFWKGRSTRRRPARSMARHAC